MTLILYNSSSMLILWIFVAYIVAFAYRAGHINFRENVGFFYRKVKTDGEGCQRTKA